MATEHMSLEEFKRLNAEREAKFNKSNRVKPKSSSGTPRKKLTQWESSEQQALMIHLHGEKQRGSILAPVYDAIYHVPNGGLRDYKTAKEMKKQGVKSGVSDLVLPIARGGYFGLYIEFKASRPHNSSLSEDQFEWLRMVADNGYAATYAVGKEEAKEIITNYMSLPPTAFTPMVDDLGGTNWREEGGKSKGK